MGAMFHYIAKFTISKFECKYIKYNVLKIPTDFFHISYSYSSIYNMDIHCKNVMEESAIPKRKNPHEKSYTIR